MAKPLRILTIVGTRPEAIKLAPVVHHFSSLRNVDCRICVTAQHRTMLDQILQIFNLAPDYDLDIMKEGQDLTDITVSILTNLKNVIAEVQPDWVLVQGDTTTAFASALAAFYQHTSVAHVEAGLRSGDKNAPWPEEINRKLVGGLADLHFAPTESARHNLLQEGVADAAIVVTGNTVIDALLHIVKRLEDKKHASVLDRQFDYLDRSKKLILVTGHRRENFGRGFENICSALSKLASTRDDVEIVYPVHLNPNVQEPVRRVLGNLNNVHLIEPVDYLSFVYLLSICEFVVTDSGGVQEEAPTLGKPVLVMRDVTERRESIESGNAVLVGTDPVRIVNEATRLLDDSDFANKMRSARNLYGDGQASERIAKGILDASGL